MKETILYALIVIWGLIVGYMIGSEERPTVTLDIINTKLDSLLHAPTRINIKYDTAKSYKVQAVVDSTKIVIVKKHKEPVRDTAFFNAVKRAFSNNNINDSGSVKLYAHLYYKPANLDSIYRANGYRYDSLQFEYVPVKPIIDSL